MQIILGTEPSRESGYLFIPFLESIRKKSNIFDIINQYIDINDKYKELCEKIDLKFENKIINISSLTIDIKNHSSISSKSGSTKKETNKTQSLKKTQNPHKNQSLKKTQKIKRIQNNNTLANLYQIYLVRIDDSSLIDTIDFKNRLLEELRIIGHTIFKIAKSNYLRKINLIPILELKEKETHEYIKCILEGLILSSYKFDKYKTSKALDGKSSKNKYKLEKVVLVNKKHLIKYKDIYQLKIIASSVFLARDLINEPANQNRIGRFIDSIKTHITKYKIPVKLEILTKTQLEKLGMGLILGVGQGSTEENAPCMIIMSYQGKNSKDKEEKDGKGPEWILLGKGITFDTGGLDLKSAKSMHDMKSDLSGAAAVMAFLLGYAGSRGSKSIMTVCPFAENSISASAVKPSDVLKAYDGTTVEVSDTDAEGRLVLADALAYCVHFYPKARLLDMATLTGQAESVSGKAFSTVISVNSEIETENIIKKSNEISEALVRLPLLEKELSKLESYVADIKNVNYKSSADIIMSTLFMRQFIKKNTPWIHIDIAGPAFEADGVIKYASPEASGVGVRLLFANFYE